MMPSAREFFAGGVIALTMAFAGAAVAYALEMHRENAILEERTRMYDITRNVIVEATHPEGWVRARLTEPMGSYEYVQFRISDATDMTERELIAERGTLLGFGPPKRIALADVLPGSFATTRLLLAPDGSLSAARFVVLVAPR